MKNVQRQDDQDNGYPEPVRAPKVYRLRDLWINAESFETDKLAIARNFAQTGATDVVWSVIFHNVDGARYIDQEAAGRVDQFDSMTIRFEDILPNTTRPMNGSTSGVVLTEPSDK